LQIHNLQFEDEDRIHHSLAAKRRGADLSDELLAAMSRYQGCREFASFNKHGSRQTPREIRIRSERLKNVSM